MRRRVQEPVELFLAGAHWELSVALIKCQGSVYRGCANLLARLCSGLAGGLLFVARVKETQWLGMRLWFM